MDGLELADVLAQLRANLAQAQQEGAGQDLRFALDDIEVELQVAVTKEGTGKAGVKFWVINAEAGGKLSDVTTQKIKLKMKAVDKDGHPLAIADKRRR
jgi:hypothetical protein